MIAASEPQEFIPSGRQQVNRHPGRLMPFSKSSQQTSEAFLLHYFQRVSLTDNEPVEKWLVREAPTTENLSYDNYFTRQHYNFENCPSKLKQTGQTSSDSFDNDLSSSNYESITENVSKKLKIKSSNNSESGKGESRILRRKHNDNVSSDFVEEELYVKGNAVVWSKGLISSPSSDFSPSESRTTICTYSMENSVKHALWCTFHRTRPSLKSDEVVQPTSDLPACSLQCICILDEFTMRVFAENGEDFIESLQFPVANVWKTKYGLLMEVEQPPGDNHDMSQLSKKTVLYDNFEPTIMSLAHPLDEYCPVVIKHSSLTSNVVSDPTQTIVFTSEEPSLCMLYDKKTGLHSLYILRSLLPNEKLEYNATHSQNFLNTQNSSHIQSPFNVSSKQKSNVSLWNAHSMGVPLAAGSPYWSRPNSVSSLASPQMSRCQSPMASISRCNSPSISPMVGVPWLNRSSRFPQSNTSAAITSEIPSLTHCETTFNATKPLNPNLCLEHVWTENQGISKECGSANGMATKVFIFTDFVGQMHICFLIPTLYQLYIAKLEITNSDNLIVGFITKIRAKDVISIPYLNLIAVLEPDGQVVLRSGLTIVGKLHVSGVAVGLCASPHYASNAAATQLSSPFPRRSSLLPTLNTPGTGDIKLNDSAYLLSPVPNISSQSHLENSPFYHSIINEGTHLVGLRDAVFDRITLQYSDNVYYRMRLPPLAESALVRVCLSALRTSLQRDLAMSLTSRWYATRNAPGPIEISLEQEWKMFTNLLLSMLGYDMELLEFGLKFSNSPEPKRKKASNQGDNFDWEDLLKTSMNAELANSFTSLLNFNMKNSPSTKIEIKRKVGRINTNTPLFSFLPLIFYTLHLVYEELKLNMLYLNELKLLITLLHQLASDLHLRKYLIHYWTDFPNLCTNTVNELESQIFETDFKKMSLYSLLNAPPANIFAHLYNIMCGRDSTPYPYIANVNPRSRDVIQLTTMIVACRKNKFLPKESLFHQVIPPGSRIDQTHLEFGLNVSSKSSFNLAEEIVVAIARKGFTRREIENLPPALNLLFHEALWQCRENPSPLWSSHIYELLQRTDLVYQNDSELKPVQVTVNEEMLRLYAESGEGDEEMRAAHMILTNMKNEVQDGMENIENEVLKLRFPKDRRVAEVRKLLQSATPVQIRITQRPEVTDHDFIEEQEKHLYSICTRTMALSVGRGMFTLRTHSPVITETLPIAKLCLSGKAIPRGNSVELTHIDVPPNVNLWPLFHNGVAAGLRITPNAIDIDSNWIVFNRPKVMHDTTPEHAGFLMALGLNGHLGNLEILNTFDYLVKVNEMISIGLLLGLATTKRGTLDTSTTRMLSIHLEALLPPTSMELDIPQNIQIAALLGIGLVYQASSHRHITEVLLTEIGRPPGPEMENSVDRESYALAAGLALGLVTLGQGGKSSGIADLGVPDMLHYYMVGGNKRPLTGSQKDKYKVGSFQIREGSSVNLDVTAPGATLALGLMYLGSGNQAIAEWMRPPGTQYLLDFVRPDLLLLRVVARGLILWDEIEPTKEWVEHLIPAAIRPYCMVTPEEDVDPNVDFETMNQAYCNIIAGACFTLGLRYAGSADDNAFEVLHYYCRMFVSLTGKSIAELAGKPTIETCLNLILLSLSMVMAGTGDLTVLRLVRHLRRRISPACSATVTYGAHLAMHMALGLLFLGGGKLTLSSSPASVAAMLCAFFPKFPMHSNDNRYHLQAFRHLYVLAVEPRLIIPRDVLQGTACYTHLTLVFANGTQKRMKAPCILPELATLEKIQVDDDRYWPIVFEKDRNWDQLMYLNPYKHLKGSEEKRKLLKSTGHLNVKQRAGCLSYLQDPTGTKSLIARTLTESCVTPWLVQSDDITSFSSDQMVLNFIDQYLTLVNRTEEVNFKELELKQLLSTLMYECVTKDKLAILPTWIDIIKAIKDLDLLNNPFLIWQLKLVCAQISGKPNGKSLINTEFALALEQQVACVMDLWQNALHVPIMNYVQKGEIPKDCDTQNKLAKFVTFYDIPWNLEIEENDTILPTLVKLQLLKLPSLAISKILEIIQM